MQENYFSYDLPEKDNSALLRIPAEKFICEVKEFQI